MICVFARDRRTQEVTNWIITETLFDAQDIALKQSHAALCEALARLESDEGEGMPLQEDFTIAGRPAALHPAALLTAENGGPR